MTLALAWNYAFNAAFEAWEARQTIRGRSWRRRLIHAALFEAGLMALLVPFLAWWLGITLLQAFLADLGLLLFFALYTPLFTLAFDRVFGLPASAR
jgi:uncharacterized membrane protein